VISLRVAGRADFAAVAALRRRWAEEQAGHDLDDPSFDEVFEAWFDREHDQRVTLLAEDAGAAVGMLNMLVFTRMPKSGRPVSRWGFVATVYVDPSRSTSGPGSSRPRT
jgi:H2-forming N5,N10-methylenetetrahydromethanopterin dehydrogenase-like enzyme